MQDFQIAAAHGKEIAAGFRKLKESFEVNLPSDECSQTRASGKGAVGKTMLATRLAASGTASASAGKEYAPSIITLATEARNFV